MLVLSRKPGERIYIGEDIWIEVRRVAGNRVTLAIEAPKDVHILRGELERFETASVDDRSSAGAAPYRVEHFRVPREAATSARRSRLQLSRV